jgi:hypothetical protein
MEAWGFIWIMLILKIPLVALLWIVWWAVHSTPDPGATGDDDGGLGVPHPHDPAPLPPAPRRRGPHGEPVLPSPPRTRGPARAPAPTASPDRS